MWGWFVHYCSEVNDTRNDSLIIHQFVPSWSDSWNIAFYCGRIFAQSLSNFGIKWNCVLIILLLTHEGWDFLDWHFSNYGQNFVQCYSLSKLSRLSVKYCTIWLCFTIGPIWSNSWLIWKRYHALFENERLIYFNLYLNKFFAYTIYKNYTDRYIIAKFNKNETEF